MLRQVARPIEPHADQERVLGEVTDFRHRQYPEGNSDESCAHSQQLGK